MKKLIAMLLALSMLLSLAACGQSSDSANEVEEATTAKETTVVEEASEEEAEASSTAVELTEGASFEYLEAVTINGVTTGGSFYAYLASNLHDYDILSNAMNGVIILYPDTPCSSAEEALALLDSLGLIEIAEEFPACILVMNPLDGEGYTEADLDLYYEAQYYLAGGHIGTDEDVTAGEYDRHTMNTLQYVIAEGSGATFVNNVLSQHAERIAGILTFGGTIDEGIETGLSIPAYLVNADEAVVAYYQTVNGTDVQEGNISYNSSYTLKKVIVAEGSDSFDAENVQKAWTTMLSQTMRLAIATNIVLSSEDTSEWVLMDWPNLSELGMNLYSFEFDAESGTAEYYTEAVTKSENSVHLFVPDAVEENPDEAVPLVITLHGLSDDPLNLVYGCGWAQVAAEENFIVVSPASEDADYVVQILEYVESLYNIDTTRLYVSGFSMGGLYTSELAKNYPELIAAMAPMGSAGGSLVDNFDNDAYDMPTIMIVGSLDSLNVAENEDGTLSIVETLTPALAQAFEMNEITLGDADYSEYPYWGYEPDEYEVIYDKDLEWQISSFYSEKYSDPVVQTVMLIGAGHSNADYMAQLAWNFMSNFARAEDGSTIDLNDQ